MTSIHVVPDRHQYIGLRQAHMLHRIDNSIRAVIIEELNFLNWEICEFCIKIRRRSVTI